jgi:hypothetical protein
MKKFIDSCLERPLVVIIGVFAGWSIANAAVTVVLTGPATYADPQWKSMCISNKNGDPNYRANIEVCPSSSDPGVPGACSTTEISVGSLPASAQTLINYMINQWCTAHSGYCT